MKKLLLLFCFLVIIFCPSCSKKEFKASYGEKEYALKVVEGFSHTDTVDLKSLGYSMVSEDEEPPFSVDDPNTVTFYPVSDSGHTSSTLFYLYQNALVINSDGSSTRTASAWWKPGIGDYGVYSVEFTVTDSEGLSDTQTVKITVLQSTNRPPTLFAKYEMEKNNVHN